MLRMQMSEVNYRSSSSPSSLIYVLGGNLLRSTIVPKLIAGNLKLVAKFD